GGLRRGESGAARVGSRLRSPQDRLRLRRPLSCAVRDGPPGRGGEKQRNDAPRFFDLPHLLRLTAMRTARIALLTAACAAAFAALGNVVSTAGPRFYPDDPAVREPESQDASRAARADMEDLYEMFINLMETPGYKPSGLRAKDLNTIDEVPDSSWFTNRIGTRTVTTDEVTRGPIVGAPPDPSRWVLVREKIAGAHPGVTAKDANGETWFL